MCRVKRISILLVKVQLGQRLATSPTLNLHQAPPQERYTAIILLQALGLVIVVIFLEIALWLPGMMIGK